ncbi:RNA polymerase sigma factor [Acanthopleuribacter pedis]|uniref:RNA polymerase sigma factor n=1 Tax=Acanthopleuribacter pedis TaxID=442870 RepID=A0A8J7QMB3_9BACT|nr:RNA polymerase sigma factor [Acanthopleuribacter pedis]MBO1320993.1 RNA polymerase sigma factor [Acanthopleuribacter pedis]
MDNPVGFTFADPPQTAPRPHELHEGSDPPWLSPERVAELRLELGRAIQRMCPPRLAAQADDLIQISLLRLVERLRKTQGKQDFNLAYIKRTALCALIDEIRRVRARGETAFEPEDGGEPAHPHRDADPQQQLWARQIGDHIRDCLANLITPRRLAVLLKLQGESGRETATILGWTLRKTENLISRGMADLRQCLKGKGHG